METSFLETNKLFFKQPPIKCHNSNSELSTSMIRPVQPELIVVPSSYGTPSLPK